MKDIEEHDIGILIMIETDYMNQNISARMMLVTLTLRSENPSHLL